MFANGGRAVVVVVINTADDLPLCAGCGRCCHLVVELRAGDVVPEFMVVEHAGVRCMDQRGDGACVALDPATMLCGIYAERPQTCRDFNRGETLCRRILGRPAAAAAGEKREET
jgi:Fe-S-cluster containining protein